MWRFMVLLALGVLSPAVQALPPSLFVADSGCNDGICMTGLGVAFPARRFLSEGEGWRVDQIWKTRIAYWHSTHGAGLWDVGIAPAFRLTSRNGFFGEAAIGAHMLSRTRIGVRELSTAFQFGEQLAAGFTFGRNRDFTLAVRAEHVSNGGIKRPNDGMTLVGLELQVGIP